jgi:hypothetical protein
MKFLADAHVSVEMIAMIRGEGKVCAAARPTPCSTEEEVAVFKNVPGQHVIFYAFNITTGVAKTGDAANITAYRSLDGGTVTVLGDTSATELSSTHAPGYYMFDLTQAETNGDIVLYTAQSTTANIVVKVADVVQAVPADFNTVSVNPSALMDLGKALGTVVSTNRVGGQPAKTAIAPVASGKEKVVPTHSGDFTEVDWYGTRYWFVGLQAKAIELLWPEWEKGMGLHEKYIGNKAESDSNNFRLAHVFRKHPAWRTMIVPAGGKGRYMLKRPGITE